MVACAVLIITSVFLFMFNTKMVNHDCRELDCQVCYQLQVYEQLLEKITFDDSDLAVNLLLKEAYWGLIVLLMFFCANDTLVSLKVKLSC